jgi:hypothetical protein
MADGYNLLWNSLLFSYQPLTFLCHSYFVLLILGFSGIPLIGSLSNNL